MIFSVCSTFCSMLSLRGEEEEERAENFILYFLSKDDDKKQRQIRCAIRNFGCPFEIGPNIMQTRMNQMRE